MRSEEYDGRRRQVTGETITFVVSGNPSRPHDISRRFLQALQLPVASSPANELLFLRRT